MFNSISFSISIYHIHVIIRIISSLFIYLFVYAYISIGLDEKILENIDHNFYLFYFKNKILFEFILLLDLEYVNMIEHLGFFCYKISTEKY